MHALIYDHVCFYTETHKYGILEVDKDLRVLCMREKPTATETQSRRAVSSLVYWEGCLQETLSSMFLPHLISMPDMLVILAS